MKPDLNEHMGINERSNTHSRRRFSINSGLNLSPVTYSVNSEYAFKLPNGLRTESMFVRKGWDDACRKVDFEMVPKENKVLKASPGRRVRGGEYREISLRRWFSLVGNSVNMGRQTHLCRDQIGDVCILCLSEFLDGILDRGD